MVADGEHLKAECLRQTCGSGADFPQEECPQAPKFYKQYLINININLNETFKIYTCEPVKSNTFAILVTEENNINFSVVLSTTGRA